MYGAIVLDLSRLRVLVELERHGTMARVAEALSYSPSAISQQLSRLEEETGVQLLEPVGRRVRLTPAAELLASRARSILAQLESAEAELTDPDRPITGHLHVGIFQTAAITLVPIVLTRLAAECPGLVVQVSDIQPDEARPALAAGDFDLVLEEEYPGVELPRDPALDEWELFFDPLRIHVPNNGTADNTNPTLASLADWPWAAETRRKPARAWLTSVCRQAGFEPKIRYESDNLLVHEQLVANGHAAAILPQLMWLTSKPVTTAVRLTGDPTRRIVIATRHGTARRPAIGAFRTALTDVIAHASPSLGLRPSVREATNDLLP